MNDDNVIRFENVSKDIKNNKVLNNINLNMQRNKIYGIKGRNGSGKTMLLRAICGLIRIDKGSVYVNGENISKKGTVPDDVGAIINAPGFIKHYTGFENLKILASIRGKIGDKEVIETMKLMGLGDVIHTKVSKYSLGMIQRLGLAQAIMEKPKILILDEPTNALDEQFVSEFRNILLNLKNQGVTIVIASHNNEDLNILCDYIFEISNGTILA